MQNTHNNFLNYAPAPDGVQIFFINQLKKQNILLITLDDKKIDELSQMAELFLNNYQINCLNIELTLFYYYLILIILLFYNNLFILR
jgi:hypothetical protein